MLNAYFKIEMLLFKFQSFIINLLQKKSNKTEGHNKYFMQTHKQFYSP